MYIKQKQSSYKLDYLSRKIINLKVGNFRLGGGEAFDFDLDDYETT